ncbi:hypothetical protein [Ramlibacter tataouinensis]|nr:hypothetical protein [Ramlibacter tataouinensis]
MKPHPPALTHGAIAVAASKKTLKARRRLRVAESELRVANELLAEAAAHPGAAQVQEVLVHNRLAKTKVHEASEELGSACELLSLTVDGDRPLEGESARAPAGGGLSGHGAHSVLPHLRQHRSKPQ